MTLSPTRKAAFDNVLDTFGGTDGGVGFIYLRAMLEGMEAEEAAGNTQATGVLEVLMRFSRLIDSAQPDRVSNKESS